VVVGDRRDRFGEFVSFVSRNEYRDVVPIGVGRQPGERSRVEGFRVSLSECIVGTVLGVDGWRDDERGGVRRRVVVATWLPSIGCPGIGGGRPDRLVHCRWEITDGAVVLVGGEPTCDMNPVEQPLARGDLRECCRRCVPVCVDPKAGPSCRRRWSSTSDCRIGTPRPPSTSSSVMPSSSCGNSISSVVGSVWSAKGLIAVCSSCWLVRRQSVRRCVFCHTRVIVHKPDKPRRGASAFHRRSETVA